MMKLRILSDVHLDHAPLEAHEADADVVVLAGDISTGIEGVLWAKKMFNVPVIYVPGNHEFYDASQCMHEHVAQMKDVSQGSHVHVLDNDSLILDGVRFLGTTLWTSLHKVQDVLYSDAANIRVNSVTGKGDGDLFNKSYAQALFETNRAWLKHELNQSFEGKTVVVTHHAPSKKSIHPQYEGNAWNPCFSTDVEALMGDAVNLWIHGHTHNNFDYVVGGQTRVVCNPRGYPGYFGGWRMKNTNP